MEQQIARIALSGVPYSADKLYSYLVPPELADACRAGVRVSVPFGRGNRRTEGFVLETLCEAADKPLKPVFTVLDKQPLLDTSLLRLAKWMKARYFCTVYDALKTILPAGIWFRYRETYRLADGVQESDLTALAAANRTDKLLLEAVTARGELERSELEELGGAQTMKRLKLLCEQGVLYSETTAIRQISDKSVRMVSLAVSAEDALAAVEPKRRSAPLRYAAVEMLCAQGTLSSSDICYYTGASLQTLRGLEKAGIVSFAKQEVLRVSRHEPVEMALPIVLNDEQQQAFDGLLPLIARREAGAALLHGVTASGKTQVYIRLIEEASGDGPHGDAACAGDRAHAADDGEIYRLFRRERRHAPQRTSADGALRPVEAHPPRRRAGRARHAQRGVRAAAGSRTYHHGRGAGADLLLGKPAALPYARCRAVPLRAERRAAAARLGDADGRDDVLRAGRTLSSFPALQTLQ